MAPLEIKMETMMEGGSNATAAVFLATRPGSRCPPKSSAMASSVTGSADGEAFQDKENTVLSALMGSGGGLVSETSSESSMRLDGEALVAVLNVLDVTVNFMLARDSGTCTRRR